MLAKFCKNQKAATAIEYALIASLIAIVIIVAVKYVGSEVADMFNYISSSIDTAIE